jgi:hypothetical protein
MMNKVMTANGITGARADLIDDAHQICAKVRAGENSVALTSWVMSETGFSGFAQESLHHLLNRATEGFLPTAGLFARLRRFWSVYGVSLNGRAIRGKGVKLVKIGRVELNDRPPGAHDHTTVFPARGAEGWAIYSVNSH